jgi:hypothetical protein
MRTVPDTIRSDSFSETPREDRDLTNAFTGKTEYQEIISKAESFPLDKVFKLYNVSVNTYNRKTICPFPFHKGGRESSASFYFYPETNTFWCFGCKTGRTCVDFVSRIDKTSKLQAAVKIIQNFNSETDLNLSIQECQDSFQEKTDLLFNFSKRMRDIISEGTLPLSKVEEIYSIFDKMNDKYELNNEALQSLISKLELKLSAVKQ